MKPHVWIRLSRNSLGSVVTLGLLAALWQTLQTAAAFEPPGPSPASRSIAAIVQAIPSIIRPGDVVFTSSESGLVRQALAAAGASVYRFETAQAGSIEAPLLEVLDSRCRSGSTESAASQYWIWTMDTPQTSLELGHAARALNFFFRFQSVLPYQAEDSFAIDKLLRLQPKETTIRGYCEASSVPGTRPVVAILDSADFAPWIGSFVTGRITWLASSPERPLSASDYAVQDMPPLITYDVYWMGQVPLFPTWTFTNQDTAAYDKAIALAKAQGGVALMERRAKWGDAALRYLRNCRADPSLFASSMFRQVCFK